MRTRSLTFSLLIVVSFWSALNAGCGGSPAAPTALALTNILPSTGSTEGGTRVTISGTGFGLGAKVSLGGIATPAAVVNSTTIIAVAPVHDVGPVDVVVTNTSGETRSLPAGFTYAVEETFTISGEITEMTVAGPVPVEGMRVEDLITHRFFITGADGFYTIAGVRQTGASIEAIKEGYIPEARQVTITGDTRLDIRVVPIVRYTISGVAYELTPAGRVPIEGIVLYCDSCGSPVGHTYVTTDANGAYSLGWVVSSPTYLQALGKTGYEYAGSREYPHWGMTVVTTSDVRLDIEFVKR